MPRPPKWRIICCLPEVNRFGPLGSAPAGAIEMTVDEYETIRLIDFEGFTQEECAGQMQVARTTIQGIYARARGKIAQSLVEGKSLHIKGGDYRLCKGLACGRGCRRRRHGGNHGNFEEE